MIEVKNLTKAFDSGFVALDRVSLTVPKGAVYGLVGPNGAGKSTLIRHITGIFRPDSGEVTIDGMPVYDNAAVKGRMAYIPDDFFYFSTANLRDMMCFYRGIYPRFDTALYKRLSEVFALNEKLAIRRYSKGMQKQAAFLLSICTRPEVLVLDEPVDGLDPVMRRQVWSLLLQDVSSYGATILVSSHNLRELEDVCDHVGIMHHGRMMLERSLSELQDNVVKVQTVLREGTALPEGLNILHESASGKIRTLIVRGDREQTAERMNSVCPIFFDMVPLTLEEIFVYELGGENYDVKSILL